MKNIFSKLFYQLTGALIDHMVSSISLVVIISFVASALVTPTKNFLAIINTIIRNPYWLVGMLVVILLVLLLPIIRSAYIKSIDRKQEPFSFYISGNEADGILSFKNEDYLLVFNIVNELGYNNDQHMRVISVQPLQCPICKVSLIEKRGLIMGSYIHYCPTKHVRFTNEYSNYTMEQRALTAMERNFNILETSREQDEYIESKKDSTIFK
ncbi:hypothetical protein O9Z69_01235 [Pediococcus pentosaceus]|uniref:hypothetical protein n=1 Tax=Pediococcus pentosaceus TaxID=1255 RepID=UPI00132C8B5A|nr:hypothetical protein [Pediococcus pentosaceus]KAF0444193.1 hypothetical protein GBO92_01035 [Pediococcus pentosaceus]WFC01172.1 hypothetical protein O9Z69_01235 [Pediococcus pentosaceus]